MTALPPTPPNTARPDTGTPLEILYLTGPPHTAKPPVLCADGDPAGREATTPWILDMTLEGRETVAVILPHPYDPAEWLSQRGIEGLPAFIRDGCLDARPSDMRPRHAGRFLAERVAAREAQLSDTLAVLGALGTRLHDSTARTRFAQQASRGLAAAGLGPDGWLKNPR